MKHTGICETKTSDKQYILIVMKREQNVNKREKRNKHAFASSTWKE